MNNYFIDKHNKIIAKGKLHFEGLCGETGYSFSYYDSLGPSDTMFQALQVFKLFIPSAEEAMQLLEEGYCQVYWASGVPSDHPDERHAYTPLRQTIMLLCHEILNSDNF